MTWVAASICLRASIGKIWDGMPTAMAPFGKRKNPTHSPTGVIGAATNATPAESYA
jgi:hypothetical protein